jgi:hypothetical protein
MIFFRRTFIIMPATQASKPKLMTFTE